MWPFGKKTIDRVNDAIHANPVLSLLGLHAQENHGTVTVTGEVDRSSQVGLIEATIGGISGVKNVDISGVTVAQSASTPAQVAPDVSSNDVEITSIPDRSITQTAAQDVEVEDSSRIAKEVLQAIRSNGEVADDPIDVLQSGKTIILRGVVDNDHELRLAENLARAVDGVSAVDTSGLRVAPGAKELAKEKDTTSGDTVYTVKAGDTLGVIADKYYGDAGQYKKIAHYNNISNPDLIQAGQKIRIPG